MPLLLSVKMIPLTQGQSAMVDDEDFEWLSQYKWCFHRTRGYAFRGVKLNGKNRTVFMHRDILGASGVLLVDHKDGNRLNNQRLNLRLASRGENAHNRGRARNNTSGFKGICKAQRSDNWTARIRTNGTTIHLGTFRTRELAAIAYDEAALKFHGEFCRTNLLLENEAEDIEEDDLFLFDETYWEDTLKNVRKYY